MMDFVVVKSEPASTSTTTVNTYAPIRSLAHYIPAVGLPGEVQPLLAQVGEALEEALDHLLHT